MSTPDLRGGFDLPFAEQIAFFRAKLNLPTERWDDIRQAAHDRAFMVAGAMKADLLDDLRQAVDKAITTGTTLKTFRQDFREIVQKNGWHGWTGEGSTAGFNWRTKVIYETNLRSSYAAGREAQLADPGLQKIAPFRRYVHNDSVLNPRPLHLAWHGLTLPHAHPFWKTHSPPNGWGCRCRVTAVMAPKKGDATEPPEGWDEIDEKTGAPVGIDKGWAYAPGASTEPVLRSTVSKLDNSPRQVARAHSDYLRGSALFERFVNGKLVGEFPLAVLDEATQEALQSDSWQVLLSQATAASHVEKHPEIGVADYRRVQAMLDNGEIYRHGDERLVYLLAEDKLYRAALKRTRDGSKNYFLTLFQTTDHKADREIRDKLERIR